MSRVRGAPEVLGQFPVSCLAEEIATPGEGADEGPHHDRREPRDQRAGRGKLDAALPNLECMVSLDNYLNETTRHAHVILPGRPLLEQPHCGDLIWGWAGAQRRGTTIPRRSSSCRHNARQSGRSCSRLAGILGGMPADAVDVEALDDEWFIARAARHGVDGGSVDTGDLRGPDRIADLTLRMGPWGAGYDEHTEGLTLDRVMEHPHGLDLGPSSAPIDDVLRTASGDIELAHDDILGDLDRLRARMAESRSPLVLIGRRHVRSNNSWMHNLPALMRGRDRSTLLVHPDRRQPATICATASTPR